MTRETVKRIINYLRSKQNHCNRHDYDSAMVDRDIIEGLLYILEDYMNKVINHESI